uniref:Secreted protein n=1 Tax=Oryza glumipatula TaxID=40148 RepID=A0A0D9ZAJ3_9ORYZ
MRMLQSLLACLRAPAATALGNQHVCTAVNTCIRVVHQAGAKGELLQRFSRHAMHELIRCVFARNRRGGEDTLLVPCYKLQIGILNVECT